MSLNQQSHPFPVFINFETTSETCTKIPYFGVRLKWMDIHTFLVYSYEHTRICFQITLAIFIQLFFCSLWNFWSFGKPLNKWSCSLMKSFSAVRKFDKSSRSQDINTLLSQILQCIFPTEFPKSLDTTTSVQIFFI